MRLATSVAGLILLGSMASCTGDVSQPTAEPFQYTLSGSDLDPIRVERGGYVRPVAGFTAEAMVFAAKDYPLALSKDPLSAVSTVDIGVLWGVPAASEWHRDVRFWQTHRRFVWRTKRADWSQEKTALLTRSASNWHLVPATSVIARRIDDIEPGDRIRIEGELVDGSADGRNWMKTSLRRDDTGDGACEIILVRSIRKIG